MSERIVFLIFYMIWFCGFWAGFGLFLFKYGDYYLHREYYLSDEKLQALYAHDHKPTMILRNFLFYCCLSWYGVWSFITKEN